MIESSDVNEFDKFATNYRDTHSKSIKVSGANSDYFSEFKVLELLKNEKSSSRISILDFGCGDGNSSKYISEHFINASITGVDVSKKSTMIASSKGIPRTQFLEYDGSNLPFDSESFDIVFTSMVFHHIKHNNHLEILKELKRVLKVGGRLYNFEHNPLNPITRKLVKDCPFDINAELLTPSYHKEIMIKAGLELHKLRYIFFMPRHVVFKPFHSLERLLTWCPVGAQYYIKAIK
jgi:ubiquinone/menaquinone biosynthesis C-methylase UbiE